MATNISLKEALNGNQQLAPQTYSVEALLGKESVKKRFSDVLGKKAPGFLSSLLSLVNSNQNLKTVDPKSILASAAIAATLDLPINQNLGFAYIVPYKAKAQFQMGWKGFVQLAIRSAQYKTMNAAVLYEGEVKSWNRVTGEIEVDLNNKQSDKVVGYVAFFKLLNGFEKYLYMTTEETRRHGKRYSQSFDKGQWSKDFDAMSLKTVIKLLLMKYGVLSIEMQTSLQADQSVVVETTAGEPEFHYEDAVPTESVEETPKTEGDNDEPQIEL